MSALCILIIFCRTDYYTAISDAMEIARDNHTVELDSHHLLHLFEILKIVKVGGDHNPYACM